MVSVSLSLFGAYRDSRVLPLRMNILQHISTLAQAQPEDMEITVGRIAVSLLVMLTIAGSIAMTAFWVIRKVGEQPLIPAANRKPLHIPAPLTILAVLWVILMAAAVFLNSDDDNQEPQPVFAQQSEMEPDESKAEKVSEGEEREADELTAEEKKTQRDEMLKLLSVNLLFQIGTFAGFGFIVLLLQIGRSRILSSEDRDPSQARLTHDADDWLADVDQRTSDEMKSADNLQSNLSDVEFIDESQPANEEMNPFAMGVVRPADRQQGQTADSEQVAISAERWHFLTELRFAGEVFLVAFFPTIVLRITMVLILNDATSHPFLEMLSDGANWDIVLLIMLMAVVVAPIAEELEYRVIVLGGLGQMGFRTGGWVIASVLFALAHGFPDCIALLPLSFLLGYTYMQRRSFRTVALVHFLFNAFNMAIALLAI